MQRPRGKGRYPSFRECKGFTFMGSGKGRGVRVTENRQNTMGGSGVVPGTSDSPKDNGKQLEDFTQGNKSRSQSLTSLLF